MDVASSGGGIDMSLLPRSTTNIPTGNPTIEVGELSSNARTPNSYYEAAQIYEGTPYLWEGSSATGTDCSGLVCLSTRAESRWTTSGGVPPGNWSAMTYTHSRADFMQAARTGDLLVWPGSLISSDYYRSILVQDTCLWIISHIDNKILKHGRQQKFLYPVRL